MGDGRTPKLASHELFLPPVILWDWKDVRALDILVPFQLERGNGIKQLSLQGHMWGNCRSFLDQFCN